MTVKKRRAKGQSPSTIRALKKTIRNGINKHNMKQRARRRK